MRFWRRLPTLVGFGLMGTWASGTSRAQQQATVDVRVRVADTSHVPVAGAEVSIVHGLNSLVAQGTTNDAGLQGFVVKPESDGYQVVVRRIGFEPSTRFIPANGGDTISVFFALIRVVQSLAPVRVTTREDLARKSYFIDSDEISGTDRPLFDANDIIEKLRPDMINGRGACARLGEVFVNGRRIIQDPPYAIMQNNPRRASMARARNRVPIGPASILETIKPEHITQITYNDCFEKNAKVNHGANAVFVVLKPGIGFSYNDGSYVLSPGDTVTVRQKPPTKP